MMQRWNMYDASAKDGCGEVKCDGCGRRRMNVEK